MDAQALLLYIGSAVIFLWGLGHLMPTRNVVADFGDISADNKKIITMEWVIEGLTLCFLGVLVAVGAVERRNRIAEDGLDFVEVEGVALLIEGIGADARGDFPRVFVA